MSGPKDYDISYTLERLADFRRRNEAMQRARAAAVRQSLDTARRAAASRRQQVDAKRQIALDADLHRRAEVSRTAVERANASAHERQAPPPPTPTPTPAEVEPAATPDTIATEKQAVVSGWTEALTADAAVSAFAAGARDVWIARAATAAEPDALAAEAQIIHDQAGELQARFDTRNALLRDVIASMQDLGYFVSDPQLADPADPAGPVVLKATCGSETVTTTVDLTEAIKSVWDGQEHEHCKSAFFDYIDAMKVRGVVVDPERADLRDRPILKQHGANELPNSGGRAEGH